MELRQFIFRMWCFWASESMALYATKRAQSTHYVLRARSTHYVHRYIVKKGSGVMVVPSLGAGAWIERTGSFVRLEMELRQFIFRMWCFGASESMALYATKRARSTHYECSTLVRKHLVGSMFLTIANFSNPNLVISQTTFSRFLALFGNHLSRLLLTINIILYWLPLKLSQY